MNPNLEQLHPYPFEKLNRLKAGVTPPASLPHIALSIGEPKHPAPIFVREELVESLANLSVYPLTRGLPELRQAIANWLTQRFKLKQLDGETQVLPVNGTREALFAFAQACINRATNPLVLTPNPFYQIYEGAALLAGAEPHYLDCDKASGFIPDYDSVPAEIWRRCQLLFLCTPGNPTGAVADLTTLKKLIQLSDRYNFIIASDECYSEIYFDEQSPPPGLLQVCAELGRHDYKNCVVFHSLSKRSNLPGLRSGFAAGDANAMAAFLRYRTYHGCAMPVQHQLASIAAWSDEQHVLENRYRYREKFALFTEILDSDLDCQTPAASFYLWPKTPIPCEDFSRELFAQQNITCLPGSYLGRDNNGVNPGSGHVRLALVAPVEECREAAERIKQFLQGL